MPQAGVTRNGRSSCKRRLRQVPRRHCEAKMAGRSLPTWLYNEELRNFVSFRNFLRLAAHIQIMPVLESGEETLVGGQAVIEGVMMRAPHSYCVAVRKPGGEIVTEEQPIEKVSDKYPIFKLPVLRGLGMLGQAMTLGYKALRFSANAALDDGTKKSSDPAPEANAGKTPDTGKKPAEISSWMMTLNLVFSLGFFIF